MATMVMQIEHGLLNCAIVHIRLQPGASCLPRRVGAPIGALASLHGGYRHRGPGRVSTKPPSPNVQVCLLIPITLAFHGAASTNGHIG